MRFSEKDVYFVLVNKKGQFYSEFGENGVPITTPDLYTGEVWTESHRDRLELMLMEYQKRLKGFKIAKVVREVKTEFTVESA